MDVAVGKSFETKQNEGILYHFPNSGTMLKKFRTIRNNL